MPNIARRTVSGGAYGPLAQTAEFQVYHPYHSQGLAAGGSALLDAINRGKVHLAKFILDAGELDIVNTRDFKGKTPLIRACYIKEEKTRMKAVQLLLSRGADVNLRDDVGRTAFSYACELHCNDVVRILIRNNVDPDIPDNDGNTALTFSASSGNDVSVELIVRSFRRLGLDVDHVNKAGRTPLIVAVSHGYIECATILATEGRANAQLRDPVTGLTADQLAITCTGCTLKRPPEQPSLPSSPISSTTPMFGGRQRYGSLLVTGRSGSCAVEAGDGGASSASGVAAKDVRHVGFLCGDGLSAYGKDAAEEEDAADGGKRPLARSDLTDQRDDDLTDLFGDRSMADGELDQRSLDETGRSLRRTSLPLIRVRFDDFEELLASAVWGFSTVDRTAKAQDGPAAAAAEVAGGVRHQTAPSAPQPSPAALAAAATAASRSRKSPDDEGRMNNNNVESDAAELPSTSTDVEDDEDSKCSRPSTACTTASLRKLVQLGESDV